MPRGDGSSDGRLVAAARGGDVRAFEQLVRRHRDPVYRIALRLLGDRGDAEEAAQDAFVQAWQALPGFRSEAAFGTWMHRVVTNRCLNLLRARRTLDPLPDSLPTRHGGVEDAAVARVGLDALRDAVRRLTPEQRAVWVLRELEGCSYDEVAEMLELSLSAVKARLHRARLEVIAAMRSWT